jgi:hypothetical protein
LRRFLPVLGCVAAIACADPEAAHPPVACPDPAGAGAGGNSGDCAVQLGTGEDSWEEVPICSQFALHVFSPNGNPAGVYVPISLQLRGFDPDGYLLVHLELFKADGTRIASTGWCLPPVQYFPEKDGWFIVSGLQAQVTQGGGESELAIFRRHEAMTLRATVDDGLDRQCQGRNPTCRATSAIVFEPVLVQDP